MRQLAGLLTALVVKMGSDTSGYSVIDKGTLLEIDRKSTRLNSSHLKLSRMPSSA